MQLHFEDDSLESLATDPQARADGWSPGAIRSFQRVIFVMRACIDEGDLRHFKSLNLRRLKGKSVRRFSVDMDPLRQLFFRLESSGGTRTIAVIEGTEHE